MLKNKLSVAVHFVWATWDRQPLITDEIARRLYKYMEAVCHDDKCEVLAVGGMPDHVHLLVLLSNTVTLAELVRHVKGGSSRFVTEILKPGPYFAWQGSYGAFSVSRANIRKSLPTSRTKRNITRTARFILTPKIPTKSSHPYPRRRLLGVCAPQRRTLVPRSLYAP